MIPTIPQFEDHFIHDRGDMLGVAGWVFDCLDRQPLLEAENLTLYISYSEKDRGYFLTANRDKNLLNGFLTVYSNELKWDGYGLGDLDFDVDIAQGRTHLLVRPRPKVSFSRTPNQTSTEGPDSRKPISVRVFWREDDVVPGVLSLVRRWNNPVPLDTPIKAILSVIKGAQIAPHIDRWQRGIRWHERAIYLPQGRTTLSVGAFPGCDLNAPEILSPLTISYDSQSREWSWGVLEAPWLPKGSRSAELALDYPGFDGRPAVSLRGETVLHERFISEQETLNRLPNYFLEIVGCVLPLAPPEGYGIAPEDLPINIASRVQSGLRLPEGGWLYLDGNTGTVCLLRSRGQPPGRPVRDRERYELSPTRSCMWMEGGEVLPPGFCGELIFDPPISSPLSSGAISGDIPHDLFPRYSDVTIGRAPARLQSYDGRTYAIAFNSTAQHPLFILDSRSQVHEFKPGNDGSVKLDTIADFIIGATHYRLRPHSDSDEERAAPEYIWG